MSEKRLLTVDIKYYLQIQKDVLDSIEVLLKQEEHPQYSLNILVSVFVENLLKSAIASYIYSQSTKTSEEEVLKEINNKIRNLSHDLYRLGHECKQILDVSLSIRKTNTSFVDQYLVSIGNNDPIFVKNSEASRYGPFAKNKDTFTVSYNEQILVPLIDLLDSVERVTTDKL